MRKGGILGPMEMSNWRAEVRPGGWLRFTEQPGPGPTVYAQYQVVDHANRPRLALRTVVMDAAADEPLSARVIRRVPLGDFEDRLEAFVFGPPTTTKLPAEFDIFESNAEAFEFARREFFPGYKGEPDTPTHEPVLELEEFFDAHAGVTMVKLFDAVFPDLTTREHVSEQPPTITLPDGRITDEFLRSVAAGYRWFAARGEAPSPGIAGLSGAPVRTVHRWVAEARKRGMLPPARTGRAG